MTAPLVTVIVPAYNYAHTLEAALESIRSQGLENIEILVCDDCSTDDTAEVVARYSLDSRIRYLRQPHNVGLIANSNAGLAAARGEYVMIVSADDMLAPGYFRRVFAWKAEHPQVDVVYTQFYFLNEAGTHMEPSPPHVAAGYCGGRNEFAELLEFGCVIFFGSALVPRRLYEKYGYFRPEVAAANDLDILLRWAAVGVTFGYVAEPLFAYRIHDKQLSGRDRYGATGLLLTEFLDIFRTHLTADRHERIRGHALGIARHIQTKYDIIHDAGFQDDGSLKAELQAPLDHLKALSASQRAQARRVHFGVVVLDSSNLDELRITLRDVLAQTCELEVLLVTANRKALVELVLELDPRQRTRVIEVATDMPLGRRLNTAIAIAAADAFIFLRAGSRIIDDYVACVTQVFNESPCDIVLTTPNLLTQAADVRYVSDVFMPPERLNDILVAPCIVLESIAIRREALDVSYVFNAELKILPEWELLLRLRHEAQFIIVPSLHVQILASQAALTNLSDRDSIEALYHIVDGLYPLVDAERNALRAAYLASLRELLIAWPIHCASNEGLAHIYRVIYGRAALLPDRRLQTA